MDKEFYDQESEDDKIVAFVLVLFILFLVIFFTFGDFWVPDEVERCVEPCRRCCCE